jgi:hypothetical protein
MAAGCIVWMRGKNANRCASFVSVGTLSWSVPAEIAEMAETGSKRKRRFMLILQGFRCKRTGAARQD